MPASSETPATGARETRRSSDTRIVVDTTRLAEYEASIESLKKERLQNQLEIENLRWEKAEQLVGRSRWTEAASEYELLVFLKERMLATSSAGSTARKESKVQLARYQYCLGQAHLRKGKLAAAERWMRTAWGIQKEELGAKSTESRKSFTQLCEILSESENESKNLEAERLLYTEWHHHEIDDFSMQCAIQLGRCYIQHKKYLEAQAELFGLWTKQQEIGSSPRSLMETARYTLIALERQSSKEAAMDWRKRLWREYPQEFTKMMPGAALDLAIDLASLKRWDDAELISRRLWADVHNGRKTDMWFDTGLLYSRCLTNGQNNAKYPAAKDVSERLWGAIAKAPSTGYGSVFGVANNHTHNLEYLDDVALRETCRRAWRTVKSESNHADSTQVMYLGARYARALVQDNKKSEAVDIAREVFQMRKAKAASGDKESRRRALESCKFFIERLEDWDSTSTVDEVRDLKIQLREFETS